MYLCRLDDIQLLSKLMICNSCGIDDIQCFALIYYRFYAIIRLKVGDFVNFNKSNIWTTISYFYLVLLLVVIIIYNPDFLKIENCLLFVPLYVPIIIASHIKHKKDEFAEGFIWETKWSLIIVTAIVAIVKIIVSCFK